MKLRLLIVMAATALAVSACVVEPIGGPAYYGGPGYYGGAAPFMSAAAVAMAAVMAAASGGASRPTSAAA